MIKRILRVFIGVGKAKEEAKILQMSEGKGNGCFLYNLESVERHHRHDYKAVVAAIGNFVEKTKSDIRLLNQLADQGNRREVGKLAAGMHRSFTHFNMTSIMPDLKKLQEWSKSKSLEFDIKNLVFRITTQTLEVLKKLEIEKGAIKLEKLEAS